MLRPLELVPLAQTPLVSILMGNYNYGHFLCRAIESVLSQSYENFELIICDDGSTDGSCEIVRGYRERDARVRLLRQPNLGQAAALNAAYDGCKGQIICLLDADDRYLPAKLDTVLRAFQSHPDCGFLAHRIRRIDAAGECCGMVSPLWDPPSGWFGGHVLQTGDEPPGIGPTSALCMRGEVAQLIWPLPASFTRDVDAVIRGIAILLTRVVGVPVVLAEYRTHGKNVTASSNITVESLNHGLAVSKSVWQVQSKFIRGRWPDLADVFPPVEERFAVRLMNYQRAKITDHNDAGPVYRDLIRNSMFRSYPFALRWYWRASILFPRALFQKGLDALWAWTERGLLLRACLRIVRFWRSGRSFAEGTTTEQHP